MNHRLIARLQAISGSIALAATGLFAVAMPASAAIDVDVSVESTIPFTPPDLPRVSISVAPKEFFSTYNVTVKNKGDSVNYFYFYGYAIAQNLPNEQPVATASYFSSSAEVNCGPIVFLQFTLACSVGSLAANEEKSFTVTFKTPASGNRLKFGWAGDHNLPPADDKGVTLVDLTTETPSQIASGFFTTIPADGGTKVFYTGVRPAGAGSPSGTPGSPATFGDPFTTTIVVPQIPVTTTAQVQEVSVLASCSPLYNSSSGCFESTLTIPVATFTPGDPLVIYLRIDNSRLKLGANINNAVIQYDHSGGGFIDLGDCPLAGPTLNTPCISARQKYPGTSPSAWKGDWEFIIHALNNGKFRN